MSQILKGIIVSNKMKKTVVVSVESQRQHPKYGKMMKKTTNIKVHTDKEYKEGEIVSIIPCRPISKDVAWRVLEGEK